MEVPPVLIYALTLIWVAVAGGGMVLVLLGLLGRQVDRLLRCRACRYVIDGGFDPATCPECGVDLHEPGSIRVGRRRICETHTIFGLIMLAAGATPVIALMTQSKTTTVPAVVAAAPAGGGAGNAINGGFNVRRGSSHGAPNVPADSYSAVESSQRQPRQDVLEQLGLRHQIEFDGNAARVDDQYLEVAHSSPAAGLDSAAVELPEPEFDTLSALDAWNDGRAAPRERPAVSESSLGTIFAEPPSERESRTPLALELVPVVSDRFIVPRIRFGSHFDSSSAVSSNALARSPDTPVLHEPVSTRVQSTAMKPARVGRRGR